MRRSAEVVARPRPAFQAVLLGQGALLGSLAVAGLVVAVGSGGVGTVLGFQLGVLHSALLLAVALTSAVSARRAAVARILVPVQMGGFALLFVIGSAVSAGSPRDTALSLNWADHFLHLGLAIIGLTLGLLMAAPWAAGDRELGQD